MRIRRLVLASAMLALMTAPSVHAQGFTYRGFGELRAIVYPETTPRDDDRLDVEGRVRFEPAYRPVEWLTVAASVQAAADNLEQVEREWRLDIRDRGVLRPAFSLRQAVATLRKGRFTADLGKQFIRWGKADILAPTDRFAPRDFLEVTDGEFLAVTGGRVQYTRGIHSLDLVWVPSFTPSRIPLLDRRWAATPAALGPLTFIDLGPVFPSRAQVGARWNVVGSGYEFSLSYFDGFNHLPDLQAVPLSSRQVVAVRRSYAPLRMAGADAALPLPWFTVKGEVASLRTSSGTSDDLVLYVVQLERQSGELSIVAGYAGEVVTTKRSSYTFAPDRGLARALLGRASYTIDANRSATVEAAVRQNGAGAWIKAEYSQARGAHWRATLAGTIIAGTDDDFFGQYRRNSHLLATLRYSF